MGAQLSPYGMEPVLETTGEQGSGTGFIYGVASMQGWRRKQEDTFKVIPEFYGDYKYFSVFDGHGGSEVAKYLQNKLHNDIKAVMRRSVPEDPELALQLGFLSCDASLRDPSGIAELNAYVEEENSAMESNIKINRSKIRENLAKYKMGQFCIDNTGCQEGSSFKDSAGSSKDIAGSSMDVLSSEIDVAGCSKEINEAEEMEECSSNPESASDEDKDEGLTDPLNYLLKANLEESDPEDEDFVSEAEGSSSDSTPEDEDCEDLQPGVCSGSTGTVLLIDSRRYYCANVGDSRCVLCRDGKAIDLSTDHKPEDPEEERRIRATGAEISDGRINKCLNLSRAFGDFSYKDASLDPFEQCVTVEPSIKVLPIVNEDEFIVIASDGLWNSMTSQEIVDFIKIRLQEESNVRVIAEDLFRLVLAPDTTGDGTGCDNMTCIIILLDPSKLRCNVLHLIPLQSIRPIPGLGYGIKIDLRVKK